MGCALADADGLIGAETPTHSSGMSGDVRAARAAALGEALERYSVAYVPRGRLRRATAAELGPAAVDPARFSFFHPRQFDVEGFPFARADAGTPLHWVDGFSIPDGAPIFLPAQLVYMGRVAEDEPLLACPTSNGLACAPTLEEATVGGLFELVERDAFMLTWYNRLSLPRLDWSDDPVLRELDERFYARCGLRYAVVDLSAFSGVPVALGVVRGAFADAPLGIGAGAGPTIADAWRKATAESFAVYRWMRDKFLEEPDAVPTDPSEIVEFDQHLLYYTDPRRAADAAFLDASPVQRRTGDVEPVLGANVRDLLEELAGRLAVRGIAAYAADVTAPDVVESGLRVVRVVSPDLCALDVLAFAPYLGGRRMYHAAHEAGLVARPLELDDLNVLPHPFP